jgi:hypothetical protein
MEDLPIIDAFLDGAVPAQRLALSAFHLFASASDRLAYDSSVTLPCGFKSIVSHYMGQDAIILPLFHGYPASSELLAELLNVGAGRRALLALCASDSSVILYEISDFAFSVDE